MFTPGKLPRRPLPRDWAASKFLAANWLHYTSQLFFVAILELIATESRVYQLTLPCRTLRFVNR